MSGMLHLPQTAGGHPPVKLGELVRAAGGLLRAGDPERVVTAITADSRRVRPGGLFVAVHGTRADGHGFLADAVARGAGAVVVAPGRLDCRAFPGVAVVEVAEPRRCLGVMAAAFHRYPARDLVTVGITGTNGKTTTAWLVEAMLQRAGRRVGVLGTVCYRGVDFCLPAALTTPEPVALQELLAHLRDTGCTHLVMEVSSHALDQDRIAGMDFTVAAFTNLSRDHLDYHGDMARYLAAKSRLFSRYLADDGVAVLSLGPAGDDGGPVAVLERAAGSRRILRCGMGAGEVRGRVLAATIDGTRLAVTTGAGTAIVETPLVGEFNGRNLVTAAAIGHALGLTPEEIGAGLSAALPVPGRLERVLTRPALFVDYAHTPDALAQVLATLRRLAAGRLVAVFGCGGDRDQGKRPLMGAVAAQQADVCLLTSDNPRSEDPRAILAQVEEGVRQRGLARRRAELGLAGGWRGFYDVVVSRREAIRTAVRYARPDDVVLLAGKGHEDYQLVAGRRIHFDDRLEARLARAA